MLRFDADRSVDFRDGFRRRDLFPLGALTALGLGLQAQGAVVPPKKDVSCIYLMLVGGPSQLDTWDMKPNAPSDIRGPFRPIRTNVPGIEISEIFPRMARHADKFALLRGVHHTGPAVHDTGQQLMQTGRLFENGVEHPHFGCVLGKLKGAKGDLPAHVLLPQPIGATGGNLPHGQTGGYLGPAYDPFVPLAHLPGPREAFDLQREPARVREKYGRNRFGQSCLLARRLVEAGVRFVTINMFETVFDETTWDIHGARPFSPLSGYRDLVGPMFDMGYSSLLEDLHDRGLLSTTMVIGSGEFGRTPKINPAGGRDHWPNCWTMHMAGGPIQGGQVIGASDAIGAEPKDRPVTPMEVAATIYQGLGISPHTVLPGAEGLPLVDPGVQPVWELFRS